ncbi:hypothetical protein LOD99_2465 [Oopsacas minuta]|uniref:Uncharacterized protein n=1 Tax=Oopsacas minuta TaxID=111878 RepID=A0AAV7K208_9METZ|nr:hypothetical protein LOD99_2465 [Oopsacas minuta]
MTCIDEQIGQSRVREDTFENHFMNGTDPLAPQMQQLTFKRSQKVSKIRPMLPPTGKVHMTPKELHTENTFQPIPPLRNSSTRRTKINSFILPTESYGEFSSDFQASTSKFNDRDVNSYNHEIAPNFNTRPSTPLSSCFSPLLPPISRRVAPPPISELPSRTGPTPTQSYKFKRDQSLQSFTLPTFHNNTMYHNGNSINTRDDISLVAPAVPPKSKRLVSSNSQLPVAMPRKRKPEESRQHNLTQNISSPPRHSLGPYTSTPSSYPNVGNGLAYPRDHQHVLRPIPFPQKTKNTMPTAFSNPMIPARMRSNSLYPTY